MSIESDTEFSNFDKYVKTLPLKEGVQYLMVVERNAVSREVLQHLHLPNLCVMRVNGSCEAIRLFELQTKQPVDGIKP